MSTVVSSDVVVIPEAPVRTPRKRWTRWILPVFTIATAAITVALMGWGMKR